MFYKRGTKDGIYFNGERNIESIESFMFSVYQNSDYLEKYDKFKPEDPIVDNKKATVQELEEKDFDDFVSNGFHFVKFHAPW